MSAARIFGMFLRHKIRRKDGKEHRAWSVVENRRVEGGRVVQRQVLYLGEINDSQRSAWSRALEAFDEGGRATEIALFPEDRVAPALDCDVVSIRLNGMRLNRPRQWGACWLAMVLWDQLRLDEFWEKALPPSREGTNWLNILKTLASYQLISPAPGPRPGGSGDCIGNGSSRARWATCSARISRSCCPTISIVVWTS